MTSRLENLGGFTDGIDMRQAVTEGRGIVTKDSATIFSVGIWPGRFRRCRTAD
jgi:hypothetical protein